MFSMLFRTKHPYFDKKKNECIFIKIKSKIDEKLGFQNLALKNYFNQITFFLRSIHFDCSNLLSLRI